MPALYLPHYNHFLTSSEVKTEKCSSWAEHVPGKIHYPIFDGAYSRSLEKIKDKVSL